VWALVRATLAQLRFAITATTIIIRTLARPTAITDLIGSQAESSLAPVPGTADIGAVAAGVLDAVSAGGDSADADLTAVEVLADAALSAVLLGASMAVVFTVVAGSVAVAGSTVVAVVDSTAAVEEASTVVDSTAAVEDTDNRVSVVALSE